MLPYVCVASLMFQMLSSYIVWPSRWNIPAHLSLGFCVTAYIVPGLLTDVWSAVSSSVAEFYMWINVVGALGVFFGVVFGFVLARYIPVPGFLKLLFLPGADLKIKGRADLLILFGILGMVFAYFVMGFVPMFAEDPLSAKQFKGDYYEPYYRAAYLFRFSFSVLVACIPVVLVLWCRFSSRKSFFLAALAAILISVSLARASTALGVITFLGFMSAWNKRWFPKYMIFVSVIYPLGSASYLILGLFLGIEKLTSIYSFDSIFDIVASGAPDIFDQLSFLERFWQVNNFTYGKTFFGGLVPGNYMWNPSVWTLTFDNLGADISDTVSGGLRFSVALWGYASFGWFGVVFVPFFSGLMNGVFISFMKRLPFNKSLVGAVLVISLYMTLGKQMVEFYMLSIHSLPAIACVLVLCFSANKNSPKNKSLLKYFFRSTERVS